MKVLSKGTWSQKIKCPECGAELEIEEKDVFAIDDRVFVECGACHSSIDVTDNIPQGIKERAWGKAASEASADGM